MHRLGVFHRQNMHLKILERFKYQNMLSVALPFLLFILHSLLFRNWIVDDAGISFAYSRNFAFGYGLVSQPGMSPVEGFSNFTWVILLSPFFTARIFDPIITPKIISLILVLGSFITVQKILEIISKRSNLGTFVILTLLSLNTSFVIWTVSGLENPLYVLIISLLLWHVIKYIVSDIYSVKLLILVSILSALCALTRPDGILYVIIFPLILLSNVTLGKQKPKDALKSILLYVGIFVLVFGTYIIFRYFYFKDIFPNTYYAKGAGLSLYDWSEKVTNILISVGISKYLFIGFFIEFIYLGITKNIARPYFVLSITLLVAMLIYVLLPSDWMPEFRFATPFFLLFYLFVYLTSDMVYEKTKLKKYAGILVTLLIILFASNSTVSFFKRSNTFAKSPTRPFTLVAELFGTRFNEYAMKMGIENGSILVPDLGGTLYYSHLKVYDLAGLTDTVIAKNLGKNQSVFYDYVFDIIRPTFIHTHGWWAYISNFDADPRFRQDYIAINEMTDNWIFTTMGKTMFSGDYIRKDSIRNYNALQNIQATSKMK